jgi:hypothetical protein
MGLFFKIRSLKIYFMNVRLYSFFISLLVLRHFSDYFKKRNSVVNYINNKNIKIFLLHESVRRDNMKQQVIPILKRHFSSRKVIFRSFFQEGLENVTECFDV